MDGMEGLTRVTESGGTAAPASAPAPAADHALPTPYDAPELYDRVFAALDFDIDFWRRVAREGRGPVLDVGCGTGRVMVPLLRDGIDVDGIDFHGPMLERLRDKAAALGQRPRLVRADMRDFTMPRRYARVICAFNAFAHCEDTAGQLHALRCMREHLEPDGALVLHMSYPPPSLWTAPPGTAELELALPADGSRPALELWDHRTTDVVEQRQWSVIEVRELDGAGQPVAVHRSATTQRWVFRYELELLLRHAGFERWQIQGGFDGEPFEREDQQMIAWAWRSAA